MWDAWIAAGLTAWFIINGNWGWSCEDQGSGIEECGVHLY